MIKTNELKKVIFTIDIDYEELVDAVGLDYTKRGTDLKVSVYLDEEEMTEYFDKDPYNFAFNCLNPELAESCSDFKIYKMSKEEQKEIRSRYDIVISELNQKAEASRTHFSEKVDNVLRRTDQIQINLEDLKNQFNELRVKLARDAAIT